ncbi:MAG: head-tail connector protein [Hasllibacter sp.]
MDYRELMPVPVADLPLEALRDHLRMGRGFADDAVQEGVLEEALRGALAAVEGRIGRALIRRGFWMVCGAGEVRLPLGPDAAVDAVNLVGGAAKVPAEGWALRRDGDEARVTGIAGVARGGHAEVLFTAGFGAWDDVPKDLAFAAIALAAAFHDHRGAHAPWPDAARALLAPWRRLRIGGAA